jgi:hypothetical protein
LRELRLDVDLRGSSTRRWLLLSSSSESADMVDIVVARLACEGRRAMNPRGFLTSPVAVFVQLLLYVGSASPSLPLWCPSVSKGARERRASPPLVGVPVILLSAMSGGGRTGGAASRPC